MQNQDVARANVPGEHGYTGGSMGGLVDQVRVEESRVLAPRPVERQFRAYNVGIAKTGTRSMAGIFSRYRSLHEFLFPDTVRAIGDRKSGVMSKREFGEFIRWRDELTRLDMDSSSFNCCYADILAEEFPDARLVFVIRDCYAWLDSMLNMCLFLGPLMTDWMVDYIATFLGPGFRIDLSERPDELHAALPGMVEAGLRYWSTTNKFVLDHLPADRSLILRTRELSQSLPLLASFLGVSVDTLEPQLSRLNTGERKYELLQVIDRDMLAGLAEEHCGDLMREFYPGTTLNHFLQLNQTR